MDNKDKITYPELEIHAQLFEPNTFELKILKEHENIQFCEIKTNFLSSGRQSRVSILEYESKKQNHRVIWKRMGAGKGLTRGEAAEAKANLIPYQKSLKAHGWQLPQLYYLKEVPTGNEYQIFSYEELVGQGDGEKIIIDPDEPNFKKWFIVRSVAEQMAKYFTPDLQKTSIMGKELTLLPHGLDLKPANVVTTDDRGLFFVDLFGPKLLEPGGKWKFYSPKLDSLSEETLLAVCGTREGALLRFMRLTERLWGQAGNHEKEEIRNGMMDLIKNLDLPEKEKGLI